MTSTCWHAIAAPDQALDDLELEAITFRRFLGVAPDEPVELVALPPGKNLPVSVAYAVGIDEQIRLMREGERLPRLTGVYMISNRIESSISARYPLGTWKKADAGRASDREIEERRVVYIDFDPRRVTGISATEAEKRPCYDVADTVELYLARALGSRAALGRGDSGNGLALFVALEPSRPTEETNRRVERFLKVLASKYSTAHVEIDTTVFNPARLCPAFGTMKTKGANTPERPHRRTHFACSGTLVRVPLEAVV